jgi:hypothetical protein
MMGFASDTCFLATLGSQAELQAGTCQQIRVYLSDRSDASKITGNACTGNDVNCVVLSSDSSVHTLDLSSETTTGINIPAADDQ